MENKVLGFSAIAAVLGMIAAATGFAAEANRVKKPYDFEGNTCFYRSSPALALGIVSAVFAIITQIYISVILGGAGCCPRERDSTPVSKFLFKLSWVASVVAVVLLVTASGLSTRQIEGEQEESYGIKCYVVKPGVFAIGATLALLSAVFGIAAYVIITLPPPPQTDTDPAFAVPIGANVDPKQYPLQQY
ncbi:putative modifying wall lignin-1/2 [Helianthus annuus]|nr:putative modifying wall lignin-1/2 [Helianthus annuus]